MLHKLPVETLTQIVSHFTLILPRRYDALRNYGCWLPSHGDDANETARHLRRRRTLQALCLACSRCRDVAYPVLYHTIILHDVKALPLFIRTLLEFPQAGDMVRDLALLVTFNDGLDEHELKLCVFPTIWADFGQWFFGEAARKTQPHEFDWKIIPTDNIRHSDDDPLQTQARTRRLRTRELISDLKRSLCRWSGKRVFHAQPPLNELMQGFLYCILRETPRVQRLLLQFPRDWRQEEMNFRKFGELYDDNLSSTPEFCSSLTELGLLSCPQPHDLSDEGRFSFRCFRSLETLVAIGSDSTFDPFRHEEVKTIRHLHLLDTPVQPRRLCNMLFKIPQSLVSITLMQCQSNPFKLPDIAELPTTETPTLSEVLLLKGDHLQELNLVLCYTNCFMNFIGSSQRLTSLPTLDRLEKLTIQMHLLFGSPRRFSGRVDLASLLPPNLVELNILDEWEMDTIEREVWLGRYVDSFYMEPGMESYLEHRLGGYLDAFESHISHILPDVPNISWAPKDTSLYVPYRTTVKAMLLDLANDCYADHIACNMKVANGRHKRPKLANLRTVTFQVAPNKPLELVDAEFMDDDENSWPQVVRHTPHISISTEETLYRIRLGSFLCWIPYRWTDIELLHPKFAIRNEEMSVRFIRGPNYFKEYYGEDDSDAGDESDAGGKSDAGGESEAEDESETEDESDAGGESEAEYESDAAGEGDDIEDAESVEDEGSANSSESDEDNGDGSERDDDSDEDEVDDQPEPKLLALWKTFRNIPREHFTDVTAAFARSGVQFDCFGPASEWILAIRDVAKDEVVVKGLSHVVEEDL